MDTALCSPPAQLLPVDPRIHKQNTILQIYLQKVPAAFGCHPEQAGHELRQLQPEECKISLRTDGKTLNASDVCAHFGGGGHAAAAGCTIHGTPAQAKAAMLDAIRKVQHG